MAWILLCILLVSSFQASTNGAEIEEYRSVREDERSTNQKPNVGIIFAGLTSRSGNGNDDLIIPEECKRIGICEDIPNYPEDLVADLVQEVKYRNSLKFNKDVLDIPQIAERIGPEEETIELCNSVERIYAPRAAQDTNKEWHVIVNDKKTPQQTFRVEVCQNKDASCSSIAFFQNRYEARCVQKFMLRMMVAVNRENELVERPFQVPSCCSCVVKVVS
ncbi:protein spaetzle-like [Melitaea cinxia]|uniref:protein spaetzle-like n=1 Tax=Melitaea cinxia TaxID=113334 RepID=UPI001E272B7E|nr:protein spaetzle-like [Melitaea cinxia]